MYVQEGFQLCCCQIYQNRRSWTMYIESALEDHRFKITIFPKCKFFFAHTFGASESIIMHFKCKGRRYYILASVSRNPWVLRSFRATVDIVFIVKIYTFHWWDMSSFPSLLAWRLDTFMQIIKPKLSPLAPPPIVMKYVDILVRRHVEKRHAWSVIYLLFLTTGLCIFVAPDGISVCTQISKYEVFN